MLKWSNAQVKFIKDKVTKGVHPQDFVQEFNVRFKPKRSLEAIERKLNRENIAYGNLAQESVSSELKMEELKTQISALTRKYKASLGTSNLQDKLVDAVQKYTRAIPAAPIPKMKPLTKDITQESVLLLLSDLHLGETVNKDEVRGLNEYNIDIFRHRLKFLADHIIDITQNKLIGYSFNKLVIGGLGDWVSGLIHAELIETAEGNVMEWVLGGAFVVAQFIRDLARVFPTIEFVGVVGNHGRLHKKPRFKQRYVNWDYLMYQTLSALLSAQKNVTFEIPKSFWTLKEINGQRFLFLHGDNIPSYASIPWYGIERTIAKLKELLESQDQRFDYICMGHFHNRSILDRVKGELIINGSMIGGNEYSIGRLFTSSSASQHVCGVHHKHGTSWNYKLKVQFAPTAGTPEYKYISGDVVLGDLMRDIQS